MLQIEKVTHKPNREARENPIQQREKCENLILYFTRHKKKIIIICFINYHKNSICF